MKIRIALLSTIAAMTVLSGAALAADSNVDGYTCMKIKDLKSPAEIVYTPAPQSINAYGLGTSSCTMGKITQVCMPSNVGSHVADNFTVAQCCFRVKCDPALSNPNGVGVADTVEGGGTFTGSVALTKVAQVCEPCIWSGL